MSKLVPWLMYPLTMTGCLATYFLLVMIGSGPTASMYVAVFTGALLVTLLEWKFPYRSTWRPTGSVVASDLAYMIFVQMLLPPALAMLWVGVIVKPLQGYSVSELWPSHWPIWVQACAMLLAADFMRYWLHRACHRYAPLWQLHAVHHSPKKLYWLNVGRFHPLEKSLQLTFDALPFAVLGVGPEVIALYFVFYAVNGFFQHSNIRLKFGLLNWVISSPELHRWHHSVISEESDHNFGNNLIIWDSLFGTRFLPNDRECASLGLVNRKYPEGFWPQLMTPFVKNSSKTSKGLEFERAKIIALISVAKRLVIRLLMLALYWRYWRPLERASHSPENQQLKTLNKILEREKYSGFGKAHNYEKIDSWISFRSNVPVQQYEDLRPWIERQMVGQAGLTSATPIFYGLTSGTTGRPKYIPYTEEALSQHRRGQKLFILFQYRQCPQAIHGPALGVVGSSAEEYTEGGKTVGSVSGALYASMPKFMRSRYIVPAEVFSIEDYRVKYLVLLELAIREPSMTYMAGANPSSFMLMLKILNEKRADILNALEKGELFCWDCLSPNLKRLLDDYRYPMPDRARVLQSIEGQLDYGSVWPKLKIVATWTGGSCGISLTKLKPRLPSDCLVFDIGYLSTEFRGTVTLEPGARCGFPLLDEHVFEFVERDAWDLGHPVFLGIHEIKAGPLYYVIITTASGLARYFMNDLVCVDGWHNKTPLLSFVQKGRGVTSITGEKLYEGQFLESMKALGESSDFYLLLADEQSSHYTVYVEKDSVSEDFSNRLERELFKRNIEYRDKRASGRLGELSVVVLREGAGEAFKQQLVSEGQREGQYKYLALQYRRECTFDFERWIR